MIKRLQWLYPPTARKFMYNLLTILCGRVERLTTCLAEVKVLDDATGLCNRENFIKLLDGEIHRSRCYQNSLSLCLMAIEFSSPEATLDLWQKESIMRSVSQTLINNVRPFDVLGRCHRQLFGLFLPQTPEDEARDICTRLQKKLQNRSYDIDGIQLKISMGLIGLDTAQTDTADGLVKKTAELIE